MKPLFKYGIDAPGVIRNLSYKSIIFLSISFSLHYIQNFFTHWMAWIVWLGMWYSLITAIMFGIPAILMLISSMLGKRLQAKRLINMLQLKGNETVLDAGCGKGLLLINIAKQLPHGKAVGVDIWQDEDLSDNTLQSTLYNVKAEQRTDTVEVIDADIRSLPFADNTFDCIVSSMVIHNIESELERSKALTELLRVLKPGGKLYIQDFQYTNQYLNFLKPFLSNIHRSKLQWLLFPPIRIVSGYKK